MRVHLSFLDCWCLQSCMMHLAHSPHYVLLTLCKYTPLLLSVMLHFSFLSVCLFFPVISTPGLEVWFLLFLYGLEVTWHSVHGQDRALNTGCDLCIPFSKLFRMKWHPINTVILNRIGLECIQRDLCCSVVVLCKVTSDYF